MKIIKKIRRLIERPARLLIGIQLRYAHLFNDQKALIKGLYWMSVGKHLNLKEPKTFTEKIQWLKLFDHNPIYHTMVDKYLVKKYVEGIKYIIPTIGIWDNVDDIDFSSLPNQFVLKTTHGGGNSGVVICKDKDSFVINRAKIHLEKSMRKNIYTELGEWVYKDLQPRILCETFIENVDDKGRDLIDYKFFCFNGEAKYCQVIADRRTEETIDFFDRNWSHMPFCGLNPKCGHASKLASKPILYDDMLRIADTLSSGMPFLRVDLYYINNRVYFGELTFYPASGLGVFNPNEWDYILGEYLDLSSLKR